MPFHSRSTYKDWGEDEDEDSMGAVKWISPELNAVLVSGNKLVATWSTPARPITSPSFQLCLVETEECGDTVWPKVKKLPKGQYTITLKIPQLGSDNDFFVRMVDDKGSVYDTPEFKLQGSGSPSSALAVNSGSSSSSSMLPDSLTSGSTSSSAGHQELEGDNSINSLPSNSSLSSSGSEGESKGTLQPSNTGLGSTANGTVAVSISRNLTVASATSTISSSALTPSITNNALIGSSNDNKPSTAAIVVPLAVFAIALAGLLFSLRQRSKAKEIQSTKNESALNRVTSQDSRTNGSITDGSGPSRTDLEQAMDFIARVRAPQSPRLTPLPPSIESRWRERRDIRMRESNGPVLTEVSRERMSIPTSSSVPDMDQRVWQRGPLPPIPTVSELEPTYMYSGPEISHSTSYPVVQNYPPTLSQPTVCQPPPASVENPAYPPTYSLGTGYGSYPDASKTSYAIPNTHLPASLSLTAMPRPPGVVRHRACLIPSSASQPNIVTGLTHHSAPVPPAPIPDSSYYPPPSFGVALPRPPMGPVPNIMITPGYSEYVEPQPADQSPTGPRPVIPYSTRPQTIEPEVDVVSSPYDAIARALRTPRLG